MATNPRIPSETPDVEHRKRPELVPGQPLAKRPGSGVPGVLLAVIIAAALLAAILYYMPRAPKTASAPTAAQVPVQPAGNQLQFSALHMSVAPTGGALNLDGQVMNTGDRPVLGAIAELSFRDAAGKIIENIRSPLMGMAQNGNVLETDGFATDPLKPNATRPFRITVDRVPAGWNHQLPEMKVATVESEGNR